MRHPLVYAPIPQFSGLPSRDGWTTTVIDEKGNDDMTNRRLKVARVEAGLTQLQLAQLIGRQELEVSRYETGRALPDSATKQRIAEILGKSVYELFNR